MNKFLILGFLVLCVSCGKTEEKHKTSDKKEPSEIEKTVAEERNDGNGADKHMTLNETSEDVPENLQSFIPEDYSVINISSGDANLDGLADKIVVLRKSSEETTSDYAEGKPDKRPLLLLLGQNDHSYKLGYRNDNAIQCIDCGGISGDPFTGTTIKNGYFSLEHGVSGGEHWEQVTTFKYDKRKRNWFLYKDHFISYKMNYSNDADAEALVVDVDKMKTVKDFGIVTFEEFDNYKKE